MMVLHNIFHAPWMESQNPTLLEEDWARPSQVKPWERQEQEEEDQDVLQLNARDAALGGIILSLLVATILGKESPR